MDQRLDGENLIYHVYLGMGNVLKSNNQVPLTIHIYTDRGR